MMHYATIYPEGQEWRRVHAESWIAMHLKAFWMGLRTMRRIVIERPGWDWQTFIHD
jgi:hypothetical protein